MKIVGDEFSSFLPKFLNWENLLVLLEMLLVFIENTWASCMDHMGWLLIIGHKSNTSTFRLADGYERGRRADISMRSVYFSKRRKVGR